MYAHRWILGEFATPEEMVAAARLLRERGYQGVDTFAPFPVEGVDEALALPKSRVPLVTLLGGISGMLTGYLLQWWCNGVDWPLVVGGRPPHGPGSIWLPNNIPITFELGILFGSFGAFFGQFYLNRLPRPYHPVFDWEAFRNASLDRFFVGVPVEDPAHDQPAVERLLAECGASRTAVVRDRSREELPGEGTAGLP